MHQTACVVDGQVACGVLALVATFLHWAVGQAAVMVKGMATRCAAVLHISEVLSMTYHTQMLRTNLYKEAGLQYVCPDVDCCALGG
jgi:flagellar basal body-associated protein FliL